MFAVHLFKAFKIVKTAFFHPLKSANKDFTLNPSIFPIFIATKIEKFISNNHHNTTAILPLGMAIKISHVLG